MCTLSPAGRAASESMAGPKGPSPTGLGAHPGPPRWPLTFLPHSLRAQHPQFPPTRAKPGGWGAGCTPQLCPTEVEWGGALLLGNSLAKHSSLLERREEGPGPGAGGGTRVWPAPLRSTQTDAFTALPLSSVRTVLVHSPFVLLVHLSLLLLIYSSMSPSIYLFTCCLVSHSFPSREPQGLPLG